MKDWVLTLTILPSVGLLLLSTTNLLVALSNEIDHILNHDEQKQDEIVKRKLSQLKLLSWTLIALYLSAGTLALDGLVGALFHNISVELTERIWISIFAFSIFCFSSSE